VLVDVYRNGAAANMYKQLLASLTSIEEVFARATAAFDGALAHLTILGDFADILEVGDPEACPGLVEPLYRALCDHFSSFYIDPVVLYPQAEEVIERLFVSAARKAESYQRLGHLCDSLGALLAHPAQEGKTHLVVAAVEALFSAPEEALAGPLCSWMDAIIARIDCGLITADERDKILMMSREQEQQVDDALAQRVASGALTQSEAALLLNRDHGPQSLAALVARVRA